MVAAAWVQVLTGIAGFFADPAARGALFPLAVNFVHLVAFGAVAGYLLTRQSGDRRARALGGTLLLVACMFAQRLAANLDPAIGGPTGWLAARIAVIPLVALLPAFLWQFVREFPQVHRFGPMARIPRWAVAISWVVGLVLVGWSLAAVVTGVDETYPEAARVLGEAAVGRGTDSLWLWNLTANSAALLFAHWKSRYARRDERRRVRVFTLALIAGFGPLFAMYGLYRYVTAIDVLLERPAWRALFGLIAYPPLLSIPFVTAYAVVVRQVFDARRVVRRALERTLARWTVGVIAAIPFALLVVQFFVHRDRRIEELFTGPGGRVVLVLTALAVLLVAVRGSLLRWIDRRFFLSDYDAEVVMANLAAHVLHARDCRELGEVLCKEIAAALRPEAIALYLGGDAGVELAPTAPGPPPVSRGATIVRMLGSRAEPMNADLEDPGSASQRLPREEREWLAEAGWRVLAPLLDNTGGLVGFLAVGSKTNDFPFTDEDLRLLRTAADTGVLALGRLGPVHDGPASRPDDLTAMECVDCGTVCPASATRCGSCAGPVKRSPVPVVLHGKYWFEQRIGVGGMGVVYRARDMDLHRTVAVKTLPTTTPERSLALRREAREAAAVMHTHLATIHALDAWDGVPMLVLEFLEGGTLADRLRARPLAIEEGVDLGIAMADVLHHIHRAGIVHRDVKPSNIGYTAERVPKLLDFGVAQLVSRAREGDRPFASDDEDPQHTVTITGGLIGTPLYLSPEAVDRLSPEPSFDLWSLAMVLFEGISGTHPIQGRTLRDVLAQVVRFRAPDLRESRPECPRTLADLLRESLALDPRRRPGSALEFGHRLRVIRTAGAT